MNSNLLASLIPIASITALVLAIVDWHRHAIRRRKLWLFVIIFFGLLGWLVFRFSSDRQE